MSPVQDSLLDLLACPACRGSLRRISASDAAQNTVPERGADLPVFAELTGLACDACALVYPVEDGIPVLLREEARPIKA